MAVQLVRHRPSIRLTAGVVGAAMLVLVAAPAVAQVCGDADGNGAVTVSDGVNVLRAAAGLEGSCRGTEADCDVDGNGAITLTDGVNVLRAAAALPATRACATTVKRVFATSTFHDGALGGLAGADAVCAMRAGAAGLSGTFKAWLSAPDGSPATTFTLSEVPYVLVGGNVVAESWDDLVDGTLAHRIDEDELGNRVGGDVWTGTDLAGNAVLATCNGWSGTGGTGQCGSTAAVSAAWTAASLPGCSLRLRLYCFEQ